MRRFWFNIGLEMEVDAKNEDEARKKVDDFLIIGASKTDDLDTWMTIYDVVDNEGSEDEEGEGDA